MIRNEEPKIYHELVLTSQETDESGILWRLNYLLLRFDPETEEGLVTYGTKIERQAIEIADSEIESESTMGLTLSYSEAESWLRKLAVGSVMPANVHEVVNDFIHLKEQVA